MVDDGKTQKEIDIPRGSTMEEIVRILGGLPGSYIALVSGIPVPMTEVPEEGVVVRLVRVASGG